jgi:hypothetical protein
MARYLSPEWIAELAGQVESSMVVQSAAAGRTIAITQVVEGGPDGSVVYHLTAEHGPLQVAAGPAPGEQVRFVTPWDVAVAIATGATNAQDAFIRGRIRLLGDQQLLLEHVPVLVALGPIMAELHRRTSFIDVVSDDGDA